MLAGFKHTFHSLAEVVKGDISESWRSSCIEVPTTSIVSDMLNEWSETAKWFEDSEQDMFIASVAIRTAWLANVAYRGVCDKKKKAATFRDILGEKAIQRVYS